MTSFLYPFLSPEVNSALMFAGDGVAPLMTAATAWEGLSADLAGAASSFHSVVSGLANGAWTGASALSMAAAAAPYIAWLNGAAEHAGAAGAQARMAASAFEVAQTATVHPAAVTANRTQLMALIATNFLGQNTGMIAMNELEYMEMWLRDVMAMAGYHGGAMSVASLLPSFSAPPVAMTGLSAAVSAAVSPLSGLGGVGAALGTIPAELSSVLPSALSGITTLSQPLASVAEFGTMPISLMMSPIMSLAQGAGHAAPAVAGAASAAADVPKFAGATAPAMKGLGGVGGLGSVGGGLGHARLVGAMSVPPTWQGSTPGKMISSAMSGLGGGAPAAPMAGPTGGGMPMMPMPMGGGAGGGMPGGPLGRGGASPHVTQQRPSVIPRIGIG